MHRVEVRPRAGRRDTRGEAFERAAAGLGDAVSARSARVYLIQGVLEQGDLPRLVEKLLADTVSEEAVLGAARAEPGFATVEVHPLPGVMDPAAQSVREAVRELLGAEARVSTGWRYDLRTDEARGRALVTRLVANPVIHQITSGAYLPPELPEGHAYSLRVRHVPIRNLSDEHLVKMSREAHLFLSLEEMRAVRAEFRALGRDPTDVELETIAQTWSEHCVHKTLKSRITYREEGTGHRAPGTEKEKNDVGVRHSASGIREENEEVSRAGVRLTFEGRPGHRVLADGTVEIDNLLKCTVAAATHELIRDGVDWTLSVFKDNSGVVALDDHWGVNIKVETHNRPSAIEPYGGAATGAGGCIRDVMGTGLGAKPIACTDVFCVAFPDGAGVEPTALPPGVLPPRRVLTDVTAGVRDYGNRMGIPTVNGAVSFDHRYVGNPLVFCGCVGIIPRAMVRGAARAGDRIVALGGRTGRDGIHGATFSSAELETTASTEFAHAVQIGNAIEEKRLLDAILRARDHRAESGEVRPLYHAITDCGAGGFSSAVGEMGAELGAEVHLHRAPLKYAGLSYTEIWISEAQERMILAVPEEHLPALRRICAEEGVELADLGRFGTPRQELVLWYQETEVGRLAMRFLHDGLPTPVREAVWRPRTASSQRERRVFPRVDVGDTLLGLLAHPTVASKHWLVRQYDHMVQGNTVVKPLVGAAERGPSDAAVLEPLPGSGRGVAIACGLQTGVGDPALAAAGGDPYEMALAAVDECVRNLVCVGTDPERIAILDNFCWPSCEKPENLGALVRAAEGCYDAAKAFRTPFVSGKDSLNNQLRYTDAATGEPRVIEIPPTLLITGLGLVRDLRRCVTMDAKAVGNVLLLVGTTGAGLGGSMVASLAGLGDAAGRVPTVDLDAGPRAARAVARLIRAGLVASAHDCSDGGVLCAVAEMLIATTGTAATPLGAELSPALGSLTPAQFAFAESPSRYVLEVPKSRLGEAEAMLRADGTAHMLLGVITDRPTLRWEAADLETPVDAMAQAWLGPLDW